MSYKFLFNFIQKNIQKSFVFIIIKIFIINFVIILAHNFSFFKGFLILNFSVKFIFYFYKFIIRYQVSNQLNFGTKKKKF